MVEEINLPDKKSKTKQQSKCNNNSNHDPSTNNADVNCCNYSSGHQYRATPIIREWNLRKMHTMKTTHTKLKKQKLDRMEMLENK